MFWKAIGWALWIHNIIDFWGQDLGEELGEVLAEILELFQGLGWRDFSSSPTPQQWISRRKS